MRKTMTAREYYSDYKIAELLREQGWTGDYKHRPLSGNPRKGITDYLSESGDVIATTIVDNEKSCIISLVINGETLI